MEANEPFDPAVANAKVEARGSMAQQQTKLYLPGIFLQKRMLIPIEFNTEYAPACFKASRQGWSVSQIRSTTARDQTGQLRLEHR